MDLYTLSDAELENHASSVLDELIKWGNQKNWEQWSKYFHCHGQTEECRQDVEKQWAEKPLLSTFKSEKEYIGQVRRKDNIVTIWRMWNDNTDDEILGILGFEMEGGAIKVCGYNVR